MKLRYIPVDSFRPGRMVGKPFMMLGEDEETQTSKETNSYSWAYMVFFYIMLIITILGMVGTIFGIFYISSLSSEFTNQLLVLTAHRTRDLQEPNTYSMNTVEGDDPTTRLFVCMMQADIGRTDCPEPKSPFAYRSCLMQKNKDCVAQSDLSWPVDYGFQRCVVSTFNPTTKQINLMVECMRHTDAIQGISIETQNSMRFLGSYNYASLLVASACALVSFLIYTAGGIYDGRKLKLDKWHGYHLFNVWEPLSAYNALAAFIWVIVCLCASYFYMFPFPCSGCKIDLQAKQAYPTTPWTGLVTSGLFFTLMIYYGWFVVEAFWTGRDDEDEDGGNSDEASALVKSIDPSPMPDSVMFKQLDKFEDSQRPPQRSLPAVPGPYGQNTPSFGAYSFQNPTFSGPPGTYSLPPTPRSQPQVPPYTRDDLALLEPSLKRRRELKRTKGIRSHFFNQLGIKFSTLTKLEPGHEVDILMPVLVPVFATMLLFVDGPLFVGMITPQHSPLQESVAFVFIGIFLARLTQVVVYKFMNKAFFSGDEINANQDPKVFRFKHDNPKQFALRVIVLFTYLASLLILFIPLYHFMYRISFLNGLKAVGSNSDLVSIFFLIIVAICPEVVRSGIIILMWFRYLVTARSKLIAFQILFAWEWVSRIVFVCIALFGVPKHLTDSSNSILNLIAAT